ncbi:50S ribosomal protein L32e [Candidatus Micrarchaeota archaeon]|nr:50S ribosomal protein L32e [Candidatus Micrarchaeota archaeon]
MTEEIRKKKKDHPRFKRPNVGRTKRSRLDDKWKRPRGQGNKQRKKLNKAGKWPTIGYGNSDLIKNVHPCGFKEVIVHTIKELTNLENVAIRIGATVGKRKKIKIIEKAKEKGLKILN